MTHTSNCEPPGSPPAGVTNRPPHRVHDAMLAPMQQLRHLLRQLHPVEFDCLPMPPLVAPQSDEQLATAAQVWQQNLNTVNDMPTLWIRARWACPHLPSLVIEDVWGLLYAWYQVLMVPSGDRSGFELAMDYMHEALERFEAQYGPEPVRWHLAYDAGATVSHRVRTHSHTDDPADRNPFPAMTEPTLHYWWNRGRHHHASPVDEYGQVPRKLVVRRFCCQHDLPLLDPTLMKANPTAADFEAYEAACAVQAARVKAMWQRAKKTAPPMASGTDLGDGRFFCALCWRAGVVDGAHEVCQPPCELPAPPVGELPEGR